MAIVAHAVSNRLCVKVAGEPVVVTADFEWFVRTLLL